MQLFRQVASSEKCSCRARHWEIPCWILALCGQRSFLRPLVSTCLNGTIMMICTWQDWSDFPSSRWLWPTEELDWKVNHPTMMRFQQTRQIFVAVFPTCAFSFAPALLAHQTAGWKTPWGKHPLKIWYIRIGSQCIFSDKYPVNFIPDGALRNPDLNSCIMLSA
jgi:hypothetical protein